MNELILYILSASMITGTLIAQVEPGAGKWKTWVIMSALFPNDAHLFTSMASDAGTSTFDAGIHTQLDVSEGLKLGTQVGQTIAGRASGDGAN